MTLRANLEYQETVANDDREELEIECALTAQGEERYTLRYPGGKDEVAQWPSETIFLTGAEADQFWAIVQRFRGMKKLSNGGGE